MPCHVIRMPDGGTAFIRTSRPRKRRCENCREAWATLQCDYSTTGASTCDRHLCRSCAAHVGRDRDYCLHHPQPQGALALWPTDG